MKCISTWQPWAGLLAIGAKRYETRSWATSYRGPILLHASKRWNKDLETHRRSLLWELPSEFRPPRDDWRPVSGSRPPLGCILARARLVDCIPTESLTGKLTRHEIAMGDFGECRFAWLFEAVEAFEMPIPYVGRQGLFEVPDEQIIGAAA